MLPLDDIKRELADCKDTPALPWCAVWNRDPWTPEGGREGWEPAIVSPRLVSEGPSITVLKATILFRKQKKA